MTAKSHRISRGKKRQRVEDDWKCDCGHKSEKECHIATEMEVEVDRQQTIFKMHKDITTSIVVFNGDMVTVLAGDQGEKFRVHRELLRLHSKLFQEMLPPRRPQIQDQDPIPLEHENVTVRVQPLQFASFVSWVYSAEVNDRFIGLDPMCDQEWEVLWTVGGRLKSAGFQNYCMDRIRVSILTETMSPRPGKCWLSLAACQYMYDWTHRNHCLRKFLVDSIARHNPFTDFKNCKHENELWGDFFSTKVDLSLAVNKASARDWGESMPWDSKWRDSYISDDIQLDERLKNLMLEIETANELRDNTGIRGGFVASALQSIKSSFF